jgi:hypothetical protein
VYAPRFPKGKEEAWWLVVGQPSTGTLLAIKRVTLARKAKVKLEFAAPADVGGPAEAAPAAAAEEAPQAAGGDDLDQDSTLLGLSPLLAGSLSARLRSPRGGAAANAEPPVPVLSLRPRRRGSLLAEAVAASSPRRAHSTAVDGAPAVVLDVSGDVELYNWEPLVTAKRPLGILAWDSGPLDLGAPDLTWVRDVRTGTHACDTDTRVCDVHTRVCEMHTHACNLHTRVICSRIRACACMLKHE